MLRLEDINFRRNVFFFLVFFETQGMIVRTLWCYFGMLIGTKNEESFFWSCKLKRWMRSHPGGSYINSSKRWRVQICQLPRPIVPTNQETVSEILVMVYPIFVGEPFCDCISVLPDVQGSWIGVLRKSTRITLPFCLRDIIWPLFWSRKRH